MIKYSLAAFGLKLFSLNKLSKKAYREIGNTFGAKKRRLYNVDDYIKQGKLLISLCEKYHVFKDYDKLLEIGTGWIHWYSLYIRIYFNVNITMMDVWDNRQLDSLKASFNKLSKYSDALPTQAHSHAIDNIVNTASFKELYNRFNLTYIIEEKGSLCQFPTSSFDLVFSFNVLEHVPKEDTIGLAENIFRILKPGGYSIHQIGIDDHLSHYDKNESPMKYLCYSDMAWKILFQNEVQYFNRLLMSEWLEIFSRQGFVLSEKIPEYVNIESLPIHPQYQRFTIEDLSCINLTIVHQKAK